MEVKIYREKENEALILDEVQLEKYHALTQKLGLSLPTEEQKIPSVYVSLNFAMQKQLQAVCPANISVDKYTKSAIPLEVLEVLDFCKENSMYEGYQVWYNDVEPDPMLIGWNFEDDTARINNYTWRKNYFLIARWGDCSMELEALLKLGYQNLVREISSKAKLAVEKATSMMKSPEIYVDMILSGNKRETEINVTTSADKDVR